MTTPSLPEPDVGENYSAEAMCAYARVAVAAYRQSLDEMMESVTYVSQGPPRKRLDGPDRWLANVVVVGDQGGEGAGHGFTWIEAIGAAYADR
jgi:hypothetical protein